MVWPGGAVLTGRGDTPYQGAGFSQPAPEKRSFTSAPAKSLTFPVVTAARRELSVTLTPQTVFDLSRRAAVGFRLARSLRRVGGDAMHDGLGRARLEPTDLKRIDSETLRHGRDLLDLENGATGVVPAFWRTVATGPGRVALLYAGLRAEVDAGRLLVEVVGLDDRAALSGVMEASSHLEAQRRGVVLHAAPFAASVARLAAASPRCICLDFAGVETQGPIAWQQAANLIVAARGASGHVLLVNLPPERGEAAAMAGATHAVFRDMDRLTA